MPSVIGSAFSIPWALFVAVFLYYTALTLITIGGGELSVVLMAASYLMPVGIYLAALLNRAASALARMPDELGPTSNLVLH